MTTQSEAPAGVEAYDDRVPDYYDGYEEGWQAGWEAALKWAGL